MPAARPRRSSHRKGAVRHLVHYGTEQRAGGGGGYALRGFKRFAPSEVHR